MTAQELIDLLREVDADAIVKTASRRMCIEDADCVEDLIIVKSATDSFTMKIILVTE